MIRVKHLFLIASLFFLSVSLSTAQIRVLVGPSDVPNTTSVLLKADRQGVAIPLTTKNVFIRESYVNPDNGENQVYWGAAASKVEPLSNGFYRVSWLSREARPLFIVLDKGEIGSTEPDFNIGSGSLIDIHSPDGEYVQEIYFGANQPDSARVFIKTFKGIKKFPDKQPMLDIDSLTFQGNGFTQQWIGNLQFPSQPPPTTIFEPLGYEIRVRMKDTTDKSYRRDIYTVHSEGGGKEFVHLIANKFPITTRTFLTVTAPAGGDILTPCEEYTIRWKESIKGLPTYVEYSADSGKTWTAIGESQDTTFKWKVPDQPTENFLIRVHQKLSKTEDVQLNAEASKVTALGFNTDGTKFVSAYGNGRVVEWDAINFTPIRTLDAFLGNIIGAGFSTKSGTVVVAASGSFTLFNGSTPTSVTFPAGFSAKSVDIIDELELIVAVPELGASVRLYSAADGKFLRSIDLDAPVSAFAASRDNKTGAFALLDGRVQIVNLPDFGLQKTISLSYIPIVSSFALSADGAFLALASEISSRHITDIHLIDIASQQIVRTYHNNGSPAIGLTFSPNNKFLVVGFRDQPQISLWDLPNDTFEHGVIAHPTSLSAVLFSPDGRFVVSASIGDKNNFKATKFSFPESDMSDSVSSIVRPDIASQSVVLTASILGTEQDSLLTASLCNNGQRPVVLESARMMFGESFRLNFPGGRIDTLQPGKCLEIPFTFMPKDTGLLRDTILFANCATEYKVAVEGYARDRVLAFPSNGFDFGNICVSSTKDEDLLFLRNDDTVALTIDSVRFDVTGLSPFDMVTDLRGTVIQPGQTITARVRFSPRYLGKNEAKAIIYHSGVTKVTASFTMIGTGSGADVRANMTVVPFIPEIPVREISFRNHSQNAIQFDTASLSSDEHFSIVTQFPLPLPADSDTSISVRWDATPTADAQLATKISPCGTEHDIRLTMYSGTSSLSLPALIEVDPLGEVEIPISFSNTENHPYNGVRMFEGELLMNPRLFLADSVSSPYGKGTIISQLVVAGKRVVRFRIEGNFPNEGIVAKVYGKPGLAEVNSTPIEFRAEALYWGKAVTVNLSAPGELWINQIHGKRRFVHTNLSVLSVSPNPVRGDVEVRVSSELNENEALLEIYDMLGKKVFERPIQISEGVSSSKMSLSGLPAGSYRLVVRSGDAVATTQIMVTR